MKLHELSPVCGSTKEPKRKGRGIGSGNGKTAGKGHKGQNARAGGGVRPGFEGGQMPLTRRLPKRGFTNARFKIVYSVVNLSDLETLTVDVITLDTLKAAGLVKKVNNGVKILGNGKVSKKLHVQVQAISESAKAKIEAAGGKVEVVKL